MEPRGSGPGRRYGKCNAPGTGLLLPPFRLRGAMARDTSRGGSSTGWGVLGAALAALAVGGQARAPAVAGVRLGMSVEQARGVVGKPELESASLGMRFWEYSRRGLTVIWKESVPGVQGLVASGPEAGAVRGVKVGDPDTVVEKEWGTPARVRQNGRFWDFTGAGWVLSAELLEHKVVEITLMAATAAGS